MNAIRETAFTNIDLYKCLDSEGPKYTSHNIGNSVEVIVPGNLYIIDNFLSDEECDKLVNLAEETGFKAATVNIGGGMGKLMKDIRDCDRCMIDDFKAAEIILSRIRDILPKINEGGILSCVNQRFRILKYSESGKFETHIDGLFPRDMDDYSERSVFTLHIYLSDSNGNGGETIFYDNTGSLFEKGSESFACIPKKGRLAIFRQNDFAHCGSEVFSGLKYTVRTDIMYRNYDNVPPVKDLKSCSLCKAYYNFIKCNGHKLVFCSCPNSLYESFYCVTCDKKVKTTELS
jgi:prolyl 4-hydroxylase